MEEERRVGEEGGRLLVYYYHCMLQKDCPPDLTTFCLDMSNAEEMARRGKA